MTRGLFFLRRAQKDSASSRACTCPNLARKKCRSALLRCVAHRYTASYLLAPGAFSLEVFALPEGGWFQCPYCFPLPSSPMPIFSGLTMNAIPKSCFHEGGKYSVSVPLNFCSQDVRSDESDVGSIIRRTSPRARW